MFKTITGIISQYSAIAVATVYFVLLGACGQEDPLILVTPTPTPELTLAAASINSPPVILQGIVFPASTIEGGQTVALHVGAVEDRDGDELTFAWSRHRGSIDPAGPLRQPTVRYTAPSSPGPDTVTVVVSDGRGGVTSDAISFSVVVARATTTPVAPPTREPTSIPTPTRPARETGTPHATPTATPAPCTVTITEPADRNLVSLEMIVRGTTSASCLDRSLWVAVGVAGLLWPQTAPLSLFPELEHGEFSWLTTALVGSPNDAGKNFAIFVISVTPEIDQEFEDWFRRGAETNRYPGFASGDLVRRGVEVRAGISVTRR